MMAASRKGLAADRLAALLRLEAIPARVAAPSRHAAPPRTWRALPDDERDCRDARARRGDERLLCGGGGCSRRRRRQRRGRGHRKGPQAPPDRCGSECLVCCGDGVVKDDLCCVLTRPAEVLFGVQCTRLSPPKQRIPSCTSSACSTLSRLHAALYVACMRHSLLRACSRDLFVSSLTTITTIVGE